MKFNPFFIAVFCCLTFGSNGLAAPWVQTTSLPDAYTSHSLLYGSGYLYNIAGISDSNGLNDGINVFYTQVQSNGTTGSWISTTSLPEAVVYHTSVSANGFVYVIGGAHYTSNNGITAATNTVYYSKIRPDGSLESWLIANPLPKNLQLSSAAVWNHRIYVSGGSDGELLQNTVYSATIQTNGSLSLWDTQNPLAYGVYGHTEVANGFLYVIGGAVGDGTVTTNVVYSARINNDGSLAGWNRTSPLPKSIADFQAVAANGFIFTVGGFDGLNPLSNCYVTRVSGDGTLNTWSNTYSLPTPLYLHAVAVSPSNIFVSGGANNQITSPAVYSMALPLPPAATQLVSHSFTNGNFQLQLASTTNTGFGLLASSSLVSWTNIGWGFTGTNGSLLLTDTNAAQFPSRFYRAYWPLP